MSDETQPATGHGIGWVDVENGQHVRLVVSDGEQKFNVAESRGPGEFALVRTGVELEGDIEQQCPECLRTFVVRWTGPTVAHHSKTRYCPRCGSRL